MGFDLANRLSQAIHEPEPDKATLRCLDYARWSIEAVQFNPQSLSLQRAAGWATGNEALSPWSSLSYTRGQPDGLSFTLLLDQSTYEPATAAGQAALAAFPISGDQLTDQAQKRLGMTNEQSVTEDLAKLYRLTLPLRTTTGNAGGLMRPPVVAFLWGDFQFTGVMEAINFEMLLFDKHGNPRRATAQCSMKGRALQLSAGPDEFFGVEYEGPRGRWGLSTPSPGDALDPRLDILKKLRR